MSLKLESDIFSRPIKTKLSMLGKCQVLNAAQAAIAIRKVLPNLDEGIIERGLAKAKLPGRFEIIDKVPGYEGIPHLVLDGAHTLNSIKLTLETLGRMYDDKKVNLLFACAADKDIKDISMEFRYRFEHVYVTKPGIRKQSDINAEIQAFKNAGVDFTADEDYKKMIKKAFTDSSEAGVILLVTGSFYLVSEVKQMMI